LAPLSFKGATYSGVFTLMPLLSGQDRRHFGGILEEATKLAESGQLVPIVDGRRFTLDTIKDAYHIIEAGSAKGKLVVDIASSQS
jgi:NADPH2:quinone reductase